MRRPVRPIYQHVNVQRTRYAWIFREPQALEKISSQNRDGAAVAGCGRVGLLIWPTEIGNKFFAYRNVAESDRHQMFGGNNADDEGKIRKDIGNVPAQIHRVALVIGDRQHLEGRRSCRSRSTATRTTRGASAGRTGGAAWP